MSFPLTVGPHRLADPPALAALVRADAGPVSGAVVAGQRPAEWVCGLVRDGLLDHRLAVGLAAGLIHHPEADTVCEGARLAVALADPVLGGVVSRALDAHDLGLLLAADPAAPDRSVEDALLVAAVALTDLADPAVRRPLLERLRHAGLPGLELPALCAHGDAFDLGAWLPAALAEPIDDAAVRALADRLGRGDDGAAVIARVVADVPEVAGRLAAAGAPLTASAAPRR